MPGAPCKVIRMVAQGIAVLGPDSPYLLCFIHHIPGSHLTNILLGLSQARKAPVPAEANHPRLHSHLLALQVCDSNKVRRNEHGKPLEADLTARLGHPNLVRTLDAASAYREPFAKLAWEVAKEAEEAKDGKAAEQQSSNGPVEETWLLLEYCDQGTLMVCRPADYSQPSHPQPQNWAASLH